jgi:hypothetical protein
MTAAINSPGGHSSYLDNLSSWLSRLFTDVVGSTERAAELGDSAWRDLLEQATPDRLEEDRVLRAVLVAMLHEPES